MAQESKRVALVAPHSNEHAAALPFSSALADRLRGHGVLVEEHRAESQQRWARLRRMSNPNTDADNGLFNHVLTYADSKERLLFAKSQIGRADAVIEMHSSGPELFPENDRMDFLTFFSGLTRLAGVKILHADPIAFLRFGADLLSSSIGDQSKRSTNRSLLAQVQELTGKDGEREERLNSLVREVRESGLKTLAIESPGEFEALSPDDPNYGLYFDTHGRIFPLSGFERLYCAKVAASPTFSEKEIAAASELVLRTIGL